ncbi:DUF4252 domain-containing protein [Pedobacter foliorum]|uniref:DUF4252 domain-containing protein n=1 Tax=Pedobacter foliorum TaxID=2739058 RepID=UPI0015651D97|nr:DUF4252 domain-containing protein [Pedobacter foliorum]NRF37718.1 DUF4252 domain-containing protein [Pedobacter foliorum]
MKTIILSIYLLLSTAAFTSGQGKPASQTKTMIDLYFSRYSDEPKYEVNTMGEAMVKRTNEMHMWSHPSIARIMKQVKVYKYLNFNSSPQHSEEIVNQIDKAVNKDNWYKEYFKWELNDRTSSVIYTRGKENMVTEVVYFTISAKKIHVSCYVGDNIDMESIRSLVLNK